MRPIRIPLTALSLALAPVATIAADTQAEIERLENRIQALEARLQTLEGRFEQGVPLNKAIQVEAKPGAWRNPDNWAQLARDMPKHEVTRFLGEPDRTKTVKNFEYWFYGDGKASLYMNRLKNWEAPSAGAMR